MLCSAIDVGSNTIRLLIGFNKGGKVHRIFSDRAVTRLADGLKETGYLKRDNIESSLSVIRQMSEVITKYDVKAINAVGTAAIREGRNSLNFIEEVFKQTGIKIKIISPEEEAILTIKGVLSGLELGDSLVVDMGGGSTEWVIYDPKGADKSFFGSMPVGVVNLFEDYIKSDPPSESELKALEDYLDGTIKQTQAYSLCPVKGAFIGTGGTITTLAAIDLAINEYKPDLIHGHRLGLDRLKEIRDRLLSMPLNLRRCIKGLEPGRADLIIPGIILTIKIMDIFGFNELIVSDYGLLEGLLLEGGRDEKGL